MEEGKGKKRWLNDKRGRIIGRDGRNTVGREKRFDREMQFASLLVKSHSMLGLKTQHGSRLSLQLKRH